jgi:hypothetical protein
MLRPMITISGENTDLGKLTSMPIITYTVDNTDENELNVIIRLDNDIIQNITNIIKKQNYTIDLTGVWNNLDTDYHNLYIIAYDTQKITKRLYTFIKYVKEMYLPTISGYDINLGRRDYSFTQSFLVNSEDESVSLNVVVKVDSNIISNINNAIKNNVYTADLTSVWSSLTQGLHAITITLTDSNSNTVMRTYKFYKSNGSNHAPTVNMVQ